MYTYLQSDLQDLYRFRNECMYIYEEILPKKSWEAIRKEGNKKNEKNICHKSRFEFIKKIKYIFA